jgi:hypothetical protein
MKLGRGKQLSVLLSSGVGGWVIRGAALLVEQF